MKDLQTGYASKDKPWEKFYTDQALNGDIPSKKIYDYAKDIIMENPKSVCFEYYGKKITNEKFIEYVEKISKSFIAIGVKEKEIVAIIAPTTPESVCCIYALNRIGAVANIIDPRLSIENIREKIAYSKIIMSLDLPHIKVEKAITDEQKVVYFSVSESFPIILKNIYRVKNRKAVRLANGQTNWQQFIKIGENYKKEIVDTKYEKDTVAAIVSTSGTTGKSKLAQLTNENINTVAWEYGHSGIEHHLGDVFLNIMPIFLSYGIVAGIHMPLTLGFKNVIIPSRDLSDMGKYLLKYKPQSYLDTPGGFEALIKDKRIKKSTSLSFLRNPGVGGDHLNESLEKRINEFLREHNSNSCVQKGYGMTEISSAAVVNVSSECNSLGSAGVPFPKTQAKIVNPDTFEEVRYGETGELYLSGPAIFAGYLDDERATSEEIEYDTDGNKWIRTGDIFTMNETGELFFRERKKAMFVRPDGHNNHPNTMNELIMTHPAVRESFTVGIKSPFHMHGKYPKSVIVLNDEYKGEEEKVQLELEELCMKAFSQRDVPYYYEFKDELPYTPNGKIDFRALEDEGVANARMAEILMKESQCLK